jgi:hypothetical protein
MPAAEATAAGAACGSGMMTANTDGTTTCAYSFTGQEQTFTVPTGITNISVVAVGGAGGQGGGPHAFAAGASGRPDRGDAGRDGWLDDLRRGWRDRDRQQSERSRWRMERRG